MRRPRLLLTPVARSRCPSAAQEFAGPGEDEDPVSMALTAVSRLMWRYRIKHQEVGMMYVGSESLLDRAKSIKSNLMMLFEEHGCTNVRQTRLEPCAQHTCRCKGPAATPT